MTEMQRRYEGATEQPVSLRRNRSAACDSLADRSDPRIQTAQGEKEKRRGGRDSNPGWSFKPHNRLAGGPNQPLWHLPNNTPDTTENKQYLAEGEGFEPPVTREGHNGFQDRRHSPLGHPSGTELVNTTSRYCTISPYFCNFPPAC